MSTYRHHKTHRQCQITKSNSSGMLTVMYPVGTQFFNYIYLVSDYITGRWREEVLMCTQQRRPSWSTMSWRRLSWGSLVTQCWAREKNARKCKQGRIRSQNNPKHSQQLPWCPVLWFVALLQSSNRKCSFFLRVREWPEENWKVQA